MSDLKPATTPAAPPRPVAVIDVGTSSIRMAIAEVGPLGTVRTLESLSQGVRLGKDTFTKGEISKATIEDCVRVLRSYRSKLEEYAITRPDQVRVVATSAVREAINQLAFADRIYVATGWTVEVLDESEVQRITYSSVRPWIEVDPTLEEGRLLITEVGGGHVDSAMQHLGGLRRVGIAHEQVQVDAPVGRENRRVDRAWPRAPGGVVGLHQRLHLRLAAPHDTDRAPEGALEPRPPLQGRGHHRLEHRDHLARRTWQEQHRLVARR